MMDFYFNAKGRISRKEWWLKYFLPAFGLYLAVIAIGVGIIAVLGEAGAIAGILLIPIYVGFVWASVCVASKRFHDRNMSGWWVLYFMLIALAIAVVQYGAMFALGPENPIAGIVILVCTLASLVVSLIQLVILGFLPGNKGPNQYGADPLDPVGGTAHTFA